MGGSMYVRPVRNYGNRWISTYYTHKYLRVPRSKEAGVDYYCPIGTELVSIGDGKVLDIGGGVGPPTGRFIWVGLDTGHSFRLLHLKDWRKKVGDRVRKGEVIAISGASGYGSEFFGASSLARIPANTGGPHTHATLFPAWSLNFAATLDLELYVDKSATAATGAAPFIPPVKEEDLMEIVIKAPNGIVVHLAPGVKHDFANQAEYGAIRDGIEFIRARKGTDAMALPPLNEVVGVDWETYIRFCAYFNVPTAAAFPAPGGSVAEIAAAVEAQLKDDFAAIPDAVADEQHDRLAD